MRNVYLDNNATTRVAPEVVEAMLPFFTRAVGQPLEHALLRRAGAARTSRRPATQVAALLGADPSEIVFTSCGTESDNTAIRGAVEAAGPARAHRHHPRRAPGRARPLPPPEGAGLRRRRARRGRRRAARPGRAAQGARPAARPWSASCGPTTRPA